MNHNLATKSAYYKYMLFFLFLDYLLKVEDTVKTFQNSDTIPEIYHHLKSSIKFLCQI